MRQAVAARAAVLYACLVAVTPNTPATRKTTAAAITGLGLY